MNAVKKLLSASGINPNIQTFKEKCNKLFITTKDTPLMLAILEK